MVKFLNVLVSLSRSTISFCQFKRLYGVFYPFFLGLLIFQLSVPQLAFAGPNDSGSESESIDPESQKPSTPPPAGEDHYSTTVRPVDQKLFEELTQGLPERQSLKIREHLSEVDNFFASLSKSNFSKTKYASQRAIFSGPQTRIDYKTINGVDIAVEYTTLSEQEKSSLDTRNVAREKVTFRSSEIKTVYDPAKEQLKFQKWVLNKKLDRACLKHEHIISQVKLSGAVASTIKTDPNVTLISTKDWGVLGVFSPLIQSELFNAYLPLTPFYPPASAISSTAEITAIEFATPETSAADVKEISGKKAEKLAVNHLIFTIKDKGKTHYVRLPYRQDLMRRLNAHLLSVFLLLQSASPKEEILPALHGILKHNKNFLAPVREAEEALATEVAESKNTLPLHILRNSAAFIDLKNLAQLLEPDGNGLNAFERLDEQDELEWKADDWVKLNSIINETREAERAEASQRGVDIHRIQRSWGQILADHTSNPDANVEEKVKELAIKKLDASTSFTRELFRFAKTQLTKPRLAALGAAVAADAGNIASQGAVTNTLFYVVSNTLGWMQNVWGLNALVSETAKYADNFHQPFAYTSTIALLGFLLSFQPLSYLITRIIADIQNEKNPDGTKWTTEQAYFSYGGRMYKTFVYPFQLFVWKLLGQKNLISAMDNKGGLSTPGALHNPLSAVAADKGKETMTRHLDNEDVRRERAMLIAALAVSEVLSKEKGTPIDPTTLMMLMSAHETGNMDKMVELLSNAPAHIEWERIATQTYRELLRMHDEGVGPVNPETVNYYAKVMTKSVQAFAKLNGQKGSLKGCVSDACHWVSKKAKTFKVWTSSLVGTLLTGGIGYEFYKRNEGFVATDHDAKVAGQMFVHDYKGSQIMTAATDSQRYPLALQVTTNADKLLAATADGIEQCLIYGAQGGVEQAMINPIGSNLINPSPTIAALALKRDNLPHVPHDQDPNLYELGTGREETFVNSLGMAAKTMITDRRAGIASILDTQTRRMDAMVQAFQGKNLMGYVPRTIALTLISLIVAAQSDVGISSWNISEIANDLGGAFLKQSNVIFNKLSIIYGAAGLAAGYTLIWAPVIWKQNLITRNAKASSNKLSHADHYLEQGLRNDEEVLWQQGVEAMKLLYAHGGVSLPKQFEIPAFEYTQDLAKELVEYSKTNPPVATVMSQKASMVNNIFIGGLVSTILAIQLSHNMYDPSVPILPQLSNSITCFAATYFGVKTVRWMIVDGPKVAVDAWKFLKSCPELLMGKKTKAEETVE